ncbi:MAG: beta-ketoacyl-ACP synthase II [Selenomonadales bacterium]|nr:beta-ketoacyl-ACP synthase II [Selenomonadales bacterium]
MKRVVVTGLGIVSPIGNDVPTFWENIKAGKHGIAPITRFDTSDMGVKLAAEVKDFDSSLCYDKKEARRTDLYTQYVVEASRQALADAGTEFKEDDAFRVGVYVGTGIGGINSLETEFTKFCEKGNSRVSPFAIPMLLSNMAAGGVAMRYGFKGTNFAIVSACASSAHTVGEAFAAIKAGRLDAALAGGTEASITKFTAAGFNNMKALSHSEDPDRASIPFDAERNGFVMGEGAAILVLEELEHALARGAHIYAEVGGYGATADAYHITSPDPSGEAASRAMIMAYTEAGATADQIDYINAHGTSTGLNDKYETNAIKIALGEENARKVNVGSTKSMTGHLLGAAGGLESVVCVKAIEEGFIPMTIGYKVKDESCDLNYTTEAPVQKEVRYALSNSFGFGGHNGSLCFKKYEA